MGIGACVQTGPESAPLRVHLGGEFGGKNGGILPHLPGPMFREPDTASSIDVVTGTPSNDSSRSPIERCALDVRLRRYVSC